MKFIDALTKAYVDMGLGWKREAYFEDTMEIPIWENGIQIGKQYKPGAACMLGAAAAACAGPDSDPWNTEPALKLRSVGDEHSPRPGYTDDVSIVAANLFGKATHSNNEDMDRISTEEDEFLNAIPSLNDNEFWSYLVDWWEAANPVDAEMATLRLVKDAHWEEGGPPLTLEDGQKLADYEYGRDLERDEWLQDTNHVPTLLQWMRDEHPHLCEYEVCAVGGEDC